MPLSWAVSITGFPAREKPGWARLPVAHDDTLIRQPGGAGSQALGARAAAHLFLNGAPMCERAATRVGGTATKIWTGVENCRDKTRGSECTVDALWTALRLRCATVLRKDTQVFASFYIDEDGCLTYTARCDLQPAI